MSCRTRSLHSTLNTVSTVESESSIASNGTGDCYLDTLPFSGRLDPTRRGSPRMANVQHRQAGRLYSPRSARSSPSHIASGPCLKYQAAVLPRCETPSAPAERRHTRSTCRATTCWFFPADLSMQEGSGSVHRWQGEIQTKMGEVCVPVCLCVRTSLLSILLGYNVRNAF